MYLCLQCDQTFDPTDARIEDKTHQHYGGCPGCGAKTLPIDLERSAEIKITWQELRILVIWAERWADGMKDEMVRKSSLKSVYTIADRIQIQHADAPGLTFRSELAGLSEAGYKFEQNVIKED